MIDLRRNSTLCEAMYFYSNRIGKTLTRAHALPRFGISEPTVTETLLLQIGSKFPGRVGVMKFGPHEESRNGADWEWCISDGLRFIRLRAQAKRMNLQTGRYDELAKSTAATQAQKLINAALKSSPNVLPVYAFYNAVRWPTISACCRSGLVRGPYMGCSIARADEVLDAIRHGATRYDELSGLMLPLACIICCESSAAMLGQPDPVSQAELTLKRLFARPIDTEYSDQIEDRTRQFRASDAPPPYVERYRTARRDQRVIESNEVEGLSYAVILGDVEATLRQVPEITRWDD